MRDDAHIWTTEQLITLEARVRLVYKGAHESATQKFNEFTAKFKLKNKTLRESLKAGDITKADYRDWLRGQVFQRDRLRAQINDLAETMTNANRLAMDIINDVTPGVFAYNANWAAFQIEKAGNVNMGFGLYDTATAKKLLRDEPSLLPPPQVDIPRDLLWNTKKISAQINQGIILGEDLFTIANRLQSVTTANENMALTHARTAMTGAQNSGRVETYRRAEKMGIELEKEWLATLDSRTRSEHGMLDGQHVPVDDVFRVENYEIRYPGDPAAHPSMVYNCRCTLIARLLEYPSQDAKRRDENPERTPVKDMTYSEWLTAKRGETSSMFRQTKNTGAFAQLPERMSKKHVRAVAKEFNISLKGITVEIEANEELLHTSVKYYGCAVPENIGKLYLYPCAFESKEQLTRTLVHEKIHIEQFKKYGPAYVMDHNDQFEKEAETAEEDFVDRMRKENRF